MTGKQVPWAEAAIRAWSEPTSTPTHQQMMKDWIRRELPDLAAALDRGVRDLQKAKAK